MFAVPVIANVWYHKGSFRHPHSKPLLVAASGCLQLLVSLLTNLLAPSSWLSVQVQVHAGAVSQHQLEVTNSTNRPANFITTTNTPWLLSVTPSGPQHIPAGSKCVLSLVCDARASAPGTTESGLIFVSDAQNSLRHEECIIVSLHVV